MKPVSKIVSVLYTLVALFQVLRLIFKVQIVIGGHEIPLWVSVIVFFIAVGFSVGLWKESNR